MTTFTPSPEPDLIAQSLAGDPQAFGAIVQRHQSLICSLAYSATGSIARSEDISQDVFITAWKKLPELREPAKLRPWLCGIARNLINSSHRRSSREHALLTSTPDLLLPTADPTPSPHAQAVSHEEQTLLWRALSQIPDLYREPLVLFYRQENSIAQIADALDISEDTVKQRLSRGRKLLHAEMLSFVESALHRSNPSDAFTSAVLTALPAFTTSATGAALSATAAKGSATAKFASILSVIGALLAPILLLFGYWTGYKIAVENAKSPQELSHVRSLYRRLTFCIVAFLVSFFLLLGFGKRLTAFSPALFTSLCVALALLYTLASIIITAWSLRRRHKIAAIDALNPLVARQKPAHEYRSPVTLLGFPLFHMRLDRNSVTGLKPVVAWIAIGECPIGLLFAFGNSAIAPIAIGGGALGIIAFGGCAIGLLAIGGFTIAWGSFGGLALGYQSYGGFALGLHAAVGGIAIAHSYALGDIALAAHANNSLAQSALSHEAFFRATQFLAKYMLFFHALWVVPLLFWRRALRKSNNAPPPPSASP
jgi:RNA polymerase sigma factor (sigma-70 family)